MPKEKEQENHESVRRILRTLEKKSENHKFSRSFWWRILVTTIAMATGVTTSLSVFGVSMSIYWSVGLMAFFVGLTVLLGGTEKKPTKLTILKNSLIEAFCGAVESSSLNPGTTKVEKR